MRERLRPSQWPPGEPGQKFRDERLVWLAARPELRRASNPWWLSFLASIPGHTLMGHSRVSGKQQVETDRLRAYVVACADLTPQLNAAELTQVRATGELPGWFFDAVISASKRRR